jgi:uncharacterized protein (DUF779 family)
MALCNMHKNSATHVRSRAAVGGVVTGRPTYIKYADYRLFIFTEIKIIYNKGRGGGFRADKNIEL